MLGTCGLMHVSSILYYYTYPAHLQEEDPALGG